MKKFIYVLFGFLLFMYIMLSVLKFYSFNSFIYFYEYKKHNIYNDVSYDKEDVENITYNIINYLKDKDEKLDYKHAFSNQEIKHMKDVKALFSKGFEIKKIIGYFIIVIFIFNLKNIKNLIVYAKKTLIYINAFCLVACAIISLNYYNSFTLFHKIFFKNDLWLLNPKESIIINLMPLNFFIDISVYVFLTNLIINVLIVVLFNLKKKTTVKV